VNIGTVNITLPHNDPGSSVANRFHWPGFGDDQTLNPAPSAGMLGDCVWVRFDATLGMWGSASALPLVHGTAHVIGTDDIPDARGATGSVGGRHGLVPAPSAGMQTHVVYGRSPGGSGNDVFWDPAGMVDMTPNLSFTIHAGNAMYYPRLEIPSGVTIEVGAGSILEVG
jgi:hypothetical protein